MADNRSEIVVDGDISPLRQKLREAARDLKQFGDDGKNSFEGMSSPLKALQDKFVAIGAILAGGAVFREAVSATAEWTEQSVDLAAALGITATEAGYLKEALAEEGVEVTQFMGAAQKLAANLKNNEAGLNAMGLATRDAAGNLRPLNELTVDAIELVSKYKAGTDRAVAASELFGKGFEISGNLAKINSTLIAETTERQRELSAVITGEGVAAWEEYDAASKDVAATKRALFQTIGTQLMPVLAKLGNWLSAVGPAGIVIIKGALGGLVAAFWALKNGVTVVWEVINAMVVTVAEPLRALASAIFKIGQGDFSGAWAEFQSAGQTMVGAWKGALSEMQASSQETRDKIWALFAEGAPTVDASAGGKSANGLVKDDPAGEAARKAAEKAAADRIKAEQDAFKEAVKTAESYEAQWEKEYAAVVAAARKAAKERVQIEMLRAEGAKAAEQARIDELDAQAQHERDMGIISQQEYLARLAQFNQQRLAADEAFQATKRELALQDPEQNPVELERIEQEKAEIRRRYAAQASEVQRQQALESQTIWNSLSDSIGSLWDKGIQALMNGTLTWKNAFQAIGAEMVSWFAQSVVGKMVKEWIAGQAKKLAALVMGTAAEKGVQVAGTATTIATKGTETAAVVGANAAQAGSGAAAAMASIPYVGPILALAAMAAVFAAVSKMGKTKSAMGGYDIPAGVNPMTQLHEEEMVLPKQYANVIRGLSEGGGAGGEAMPQLHFNINTMDSAGVKRFLMDNRGAVADSLKAALRDFKR